MTIGVSVLAFFAIAMAQNATWQAFMDRGERSDNAGDYVASIDWYRQAVVAADRFGPNDHRTWESINRLAMSYQNAGMASESIRNYRHEISLIEHAIGKQNAAYPVAIANLGTTFVSTGDFAAGEKLLREALRIDTGPLQANTLVVAFTNVRLIEALLGRGRYDEADRLLSRALPAVRSSNDVFYTAVALNTLGVVRRHQHRYSEALDAFQEAVALTERDYGSNHPVLIFPLNNLGVVYSLLGNFAQADQIFRRAQAICETTLPPDHPSHTAVLANYADSLRRSGEKSRAKAMRQQADALARDNAQRNGRGMTVDVTAFREH